MVQNYPKGPGSPEASSNGSGSSRSIQPSPTCATPRAPARHIDEDYDEDGVDGLMNLAGYRAPENNNGGHPDGPSHSPTISSHSRHSDPSPRPIPPSHRNSISSNQASPPSQSAPLKRALSPGPDESENKRSRVDLNKRRISSPSSGRRTPLPSTRPSPIPFRTQPQSHSPEARGHEFPASPSLPAVLPPHPRPIGSGHHALPPIATLSPTSTAPSPPHDRDDKMHVDKNRSSSPPSRKMGESTRSPPSKATASPPSDKKD